jgi:hypothetical protein
MYKALRIIFSLTPIILCNCSISKIGGEVKTEKDADHPYYELNSPYVQIQLKGDYYFHSLERKYFPDTDENYMEYLKAGFGSRKPKLMYSAHTTVPPYYSTVAVLYKNIQFDSTLLGNIRKELQRRLKVSVKNSTDITTNFGHATEIEYNALNTTTRIPTCYNEFFINSGNNLIRIYSWSIDCKEPIIKEELEGIVKTISIFKE